MSDKSARVLVYRHHLARSRQPLWFNRKAVQEPRPTKYAVGLAPVLHSFSDGGSEAALHDTRTCHSPFVKRCETP
jgi:hypothetical protein